LRKLPKALSAVAVAFLIGSLFVGSAFAAPKTNNNRPGWGYGDPHHNHTGPPGLSKDSVQQANFDRNQDTN
jgi:hypothetical protein